MKILNKHLLVTIIATVIAGETAEGTWQPEIRDPDRYKISDKTVGRTAEKTENSSSMESKSTETPSASEWYGGEYVDFSTPPQENTITLNPNRHTKLIWGNSEGAWIADTSKNLPKKHFTLPIKKFQRIGASKS